MAAFFTLAPLLGLQAQTTYTWTGASNTAWNNNANWSPATGFPNGADNAVIVTAANLPLLDANRTINNITLTSGTFNLGARTLTYTGAGTFNGGAVNNGTIAPNAPSSTTTFAGTVFGATISGTANIILFNGSTFNNPVTVTKTSAGNEYSQGGNIFNNTLTLSVTSGRQYMYQTANDQFNGNVVLNSTGSSNGIWLGQNSGSATLASGNTLSVGGGGFTTGSLVIGRLTQLGPTAQNIAISGTATLYFRDGSVFNGAVTSSSPGLYIQNTTFNANATFTKTGNSNEYSSGGCVFNGTTEFFNSGNGFLALCNSGTDVYNGNIKFNSTGSGGFRFSYSGGGTWSQAAGYSISIGSGGFSDGVLALGAYTQVGAVAVTLVLTGNSSFMYNPGTIFQGNVNVTAPSIYLRGATFNGTAKFTKTGTSNDYSTGGNTFNNTAEFINTGANYFCPNYTGTDVFNGDIRVNSTGTGSIRFGWNGGTCTLAAGRTIAVGASGFTSGDLYLNGLTQVSATAQNFALTGSAGIIFGPGTTFNGPVTVSAFSGTLNGSTFNDALSVTAQNILVNGSTCNGAAIFTKNGTTNDVSSGGNTFNGNVTFTNLSTGILYIHNVGNDVFNGNVVVNNTSTGEIRFGNSTGTSTMAVGKTISVGAMGFADGLLMIQGMTQLGTAPQTMALGTNARLYLRSGDTFNGNLTTTSGQLYLENSIFNGVADFTKTGPGSDVSGGGCTFNSDVGFTNANTGILYLHNTGHDDFNGNIRLNNTSSGQVRFGNNTGTSTLAVGKTIAVGGLGFADGWLFIGGMTQLGPTPQALVLGPDAGLAYYNGSVFHGNITSTSGRLFFSATTFHGTGSFTKTGLQSDASTGGNFFNGDVEFTNTNTGILYLDNTGHDEFNGNIRVNNSSSGQIRFGNSTGSSTLAAGKTIAAGGLGFTDGGLYIGAMTQVGPTPQTLALGTSAVLIFNNASVFNGDVTSTSGGLLLNGTTFNGTLNATKTGTTSDAGYGNNIFNGTTTISNFGTGVLYLNNIAPDLFNANLLLNNTNGGLMIFGNGSGSATLAAGRTISVGASGFNSGDLRLRSFTQVGPTPQNLLLTGSSRLFWQDATTFNGATICTAPDLYFNGSTFNSTLNATKTGPSSNASSGNNTFNGLTTLNMASTGYLYMAYYYDDAYNGDMVVNNTGGGRFYFGFGNGTGVLANGRTISIGSGGFNVGLLGFNRFTQLGTTPQTLGLTGTADLYFYSNCQWNGALSSSSPGLYFHGGLFNGTVTSIKTGSSSNAGQGNCTFNQKLTLTNSGTGPLYLDNNFSDYFNGDIILNSTNAGGIRFGTTSGSGTLAIGRTVSVGPLGFSNGALMFRSFKQLGNTAQLLNLTGTAQLYYYPGTEFDGDLVCNSPTLYFNGATFNRTMTATKTGSTNDSSTGGNLFQGDSKFTNTGTGTFSLHYVGADQFNGNVRLNNTNGGSIYFGITSGNGTLAAGKTIAVGSGGFNSGVLYLKGFTQVGATSQNLLLTGTARITFGVNNIFNGTMNCESPALYLDGSRFNSDARFVKFGPTYDPSYGSNTFNGNMEFINQGGQVLLANYLSDYYNGNAHFQHNGTSNFYIGNIASNYFSKDVSTLGSTRSVVFSVGNGRTWFVGNTTQYFRNEVAYPPTVRYMNLATTAGAALEMMGGDVNLSLDIAFISGNLRTPAATSTSPGLLVMAHNSTMSDPADNNSHVVGFVRKIGNAAFMFPVGDGTHYAPIGMSAPTGTSHHFTAKYVAADPDPTYNRYQKDATLDHISLCEYWILDRTGSTSNVAVTLTWDTPRSCGVTNLPDLAVARWDGTKWKDHSGSATGSTTAGSITSMGVISSFASPSPFTLASTSHANPLPIELLSFTAAYEGDLVLTRWATASEQNNDRFEVERSRDGSTFEQVGTVAGAVNSQAILNYSYADGSPFSGLSYYRLKQVDINGTFTYSNMVPVQSAAGSQASINVYPNPTAGEATIVLHGTKDGHLDLRVFNSVGQQVRDLSREATSTGLSVPVSLDGLPAGIYLLRMVDEDGTPVEVRIVKE